MATPSPPHPLSALSLTKAPSLEAVVDILEPFSTMGSCGICLEDLPMSALHAEQCDEFECKNNFACHEW